MQKFNFPYLSDWFAISLRWLVLLGLFGSLILSNQLNLTTTGILLFSVLWNAFISILTSLNQRLLQHRIINTAIDSITSMALFAVSGTLFGPVCWVSILAMITTSLYFELRGSLIVGLSLSAVQAVAMLVTQSIPTSSLYLLAVPLAFNMVFGLAAGLASGSLMTRLRDYYRISVNRRDEIKRLAKKQERERMQAFYKVLETLSATLSYQVVIDEALDMSSQVIGGIRSGEMHSAVLLFSNRHLRVESGRRLPPRDLKLTFPAEEGVLKEALTTGAPQVISDALADPELSRMVILHDCDSILCLPLLRGFDAFGIMLYAHRAADFFTEERVETLEMLANQAVIAIQNARLFEQLQEEKQVLIETQEVTRKQLARDLHDGPTQSVSAIAMRINIGRKMLELNHMDDLKKELASVEDLARRTTNEIRHMLFTLRPLVLESKGLIAALDAMAEKMHDTYQENVRISVDEQVVSKLDISKQTVIFYIVEEAVNNARKHAKADMIQVRLRFLPEENGSLAALEIADNGVGFDVHAVTSMYEQRGSLGMVNLVERSELINGVLDVNSQPGKGTLIRVLIPLTEEATDRLTRGLFNI